MPFKPPSNGDLRHKVTIQKLGPKVSDGAGGFTAPWVDVMDVWVRMDPWKGKEMLSSNQPASTQYWEVAMRWRPGITSDMRVFEKATARAPAKAYNIRFVADADNKQRWITMSVEAIKQT